MAGGLGRGAIQSDPDARSVEGAYGSGVADTVNGADAENIFTDYVTIYEDYSDYDYSSGTAIVAWFEGAVDVTCDPPELEWGPADPGVSTVVLYAHVYGACGADGFFVINNPEFYLGDFSAEAEYYVSGDCSAALSGDIVDND